MCVENYVVIWKGVVGFVVCVYCDYHSALKIFSSLSFSLSDDITTVLLLSKFARIINKIREDVSDG